MQNDTALELLKLLGRSVLLDIRAGTKFPSRKEWNTITAEEALTEKYLATLTQNIGVAVGEQSGGLISIDCDTDESFDELIAANPKLRETLHSHGARGGNIWVRLTDPQIPKLGKIRKNNEGIGEWRSTGAQTVIHGLHPSGVSYRNNGLPVISISRNEITWPQGWQMPWDTAAPKQGVKAIKNQETEAQKAKKEAVRALLMSIPPRPDRDNWMKISAAVRNSLVEAGHDEAEAIEMLQAWSPEEESGEYEKLLESAFNDISFGTLHHHAGLHGFRGVINRFFYSGSSYGVEAWPGNIIPLQGTDAVKRHLRFEFAIPKKMADEIVTQIERTRHVEYIGPVAGMQPGFYVSASQKFVVTKGPNIIQPRQGEYKFIGSFFADLLGYEQFDFFIDWLAHARRTLRKGKRGQTPVLALAGDRGHGKSLAIEIINRCLGNRTADCYRAFAGGSSFNGDLLGAELLTMDDVAASTDHRSRVTLAQNIKNHLFSASVRFEAKHKNAISMAPIQAVVIAVNRDAAHLRILPELDNSMLDKISILLTHPVNFAPDIAGDHDAISKIIDRELPGFLHALEQHHRPEAYEETGARRLKCYWNPEIVADLKALSNEHQLLQIILQDAGAEPDFWKAPRTASEIESKLTGQYSVNPHGARKLFHWPGACGTLLANLASEAGSAVQKHGVYRGTQRYYLTS